MPIDAHQHFWLYNDHEYEWIDRTMAAIRRDFLPADLRPLLENCGFRGSVVVQTRQTRAETEWLLKLAEEHPFILGVVGWLDLRSPRLRTELESLAAGSKLVGIRHIVQSEPDEFLLEPDFLRGISVLEDFDLAYDILIYSKHLPVAEEFVRRFPRQRFVLDHLAKPPIKSGSIDLWARGIRTIASFPNVYAKVSGLVTEADWQGWKTDDIRRYLDVAFACFGPNRLMIGSDWPVCLVAASYERTINVVRDYLDQFTAEERRAVLGGNAARFWRLESV
jgi:L-fuconolactonase